MHMGNAERGEDGGDYFGSDLEDPDGAREDDDEFSIFNIEIAQILWRRNRENTA